ncbi:tyrosine-type recombinase/integrase [Arthrobacter sp. ISL-72]|uniref:tyrosine-type recombinase/integrase n=1 Tax=Arthrobacter sp. ISL-72 TaxID=2819114 RepID=UPI001BE886D7|nr:tyrosine-type recombinase/integrase [Arthrobacter sp. ISL-72]MBT2594717.1 tyrosine-type recombinase/integrase [Arthrobacter sp. ISL-72]
MDNTTLIGLPSNRNLTSTDLAVAGYLARYAGTTRKTYEHTLRVLWRWCKGNGLDLLTDVKRHHLEIFLRYLEEDRHNKPASIAHHASVVKGFYRFAAIDDYIVKSPAEHLRTPRLYMDESSTLGLERMELGALIQTAKASHPTDGALIVLMGMLGLRVSEACAVRVEDYRHEERGHRVLKLVGKGGKPATVPLPVQVIRALDAAAGERVSGPLLLRKSNGQPMNRKAAAGVVARLCRKAGIDKHITPHGLRHSFVTACLDAGAPLRDVQIAARHSDPRITARYDRGRHNLDRHANHTVAAFLAGAA